MQQHFHKYVVWDSITEREYVDDPSLHDCIVTHDGEFISVQKRRREMINQGIIPTIIFSCKGSQSATEVVIDGKVQGIFTYCWGEKIYKENRLVTFRRAITLVNEMMKNKGVKQTCEIVCRDDVLDRIINDCDLERPHCVIILDMCRTFSNKGKQTIF